MTGLRSIWRLLNMPCEGMTRLASAPFDRDLTRLERVALQCHLTYCTACRRFVRQVEFLRCAVRRIEGVESLTGPGLPDDVREQIKHALRSD